MPVTVSSRGMSARVYQLPTRLGIVATPAPLLLTQRGQLPNLCAQLLSLGIPPENDPLLLQLSVLDWQALNSHTKKSATTIFGELRERYKNQKDIPEHAARILERGVRGYADLEDCVLFLSCRRPGSDDFVTDRPGKGTHIRSECGLRVSAEDVVKLHEALKTDFVGCVTDVGITPGRKSVMERRMKRGGKQTEEMLECGVRKQELLVTVLGGDDVELRERAGKEMRRDGVGGYNLDGLYCGESWERRWECVDAMTRGLGEQGVRVLTGGLGGGDDVIEAVSRGVDIVESGWVFEMGEDGYALDMENGRIVNCRDGQWRGCTGKLIEGCECGVCEGGFGIGYVRHLLEVREMVGVSLLTAHNLWVYLRWFERIREAVKGGRWDEFVRDWERKREKARRGEALNERS